MRGWFGKSQAQLDTEKTELEAKKHAELQDLLDKGRVANVVRDRDEQIRVQKYRREQAELSKQRQKEKETLETRKALAHTFADQQTIAGAFFTSKKPSNPALIERLNTSVARTVRQPAATAPKPETVMPSQRGANFWKQKAHHAEPAATPAPAPAFKR